MCIHEHPGAVRDALCWHQCSHLQFILMSAAGPAGEGEPLFVELLRHIKAIHSASAAFSPKDASLGHFYTSEFDMPGAPGIGFHRDPPKFLTEYLDPYGRSFYRVMKPGDAAPFANELYGLQCLPQCEWRTAAVYALGMFWSRAPGCTLSNDQRKVRGPSCCLLCYPMVGALERCSLVEYGWAWA